MPATEWSRLITSLESIAAHVQRTNFAGGPQTTLVICSDGIRIIIENDTRHVQQTMPWCWLRGDKSMRDAGAFMLESAINLAQRAFERGGT